MSKEKLYVSINKDENIVLWFIRKSDKWLGNIYSKYEEYTTDIDDMIAVSKLYGIEYEKVDIGSDPFTIVGSEPIYDFDDGGIIFQSDHKHSILDDLKTHEYLVRIVPDKSYSTLNTVYIHLPIATDDRIVDAVYLDSHERTYDILFDLHTGNLLEKTDALKEDSNDR